MTTRSRTFAHESPPPGDTVDLSGEWLIQEEDKAYRASLDRNGNGTYTHEGGTIQVTRFEHRTLLGRWQQTGNDREGGFEVLFTDDGREARGVWWYTRVGNRKNIPPRMHGGTYLWKRLSQEADPAHALETTSSP